jgi:hypothetical protein
MKERRGAEQRREERYVIELGIKGNVGGRNVTSQ